MSAAADPSYPLYPVGCILAAAMLLLVLLTSFVRQSWNLGVAFLCFWLFPENLTSGINAVIWADNVDIKLYVYCDIATRVQIISSVVKPMATLIIIRRLYLMSSLKPVQLPGERAAERRRNLAIEWTLGLIIPVLVAGPLYYIVQALRFDVIEGFGCEDAPDPSVLSLLLIDLWSVIPPLVSVAIYYRRAAVTFYRQLRDKNLYVNDQSQNAVSRADYIRVMILASIDLLLTLPIGITSITLYVIDALSIHQFSFYSGWSTVHDSANWAPEGATYAQLTSNGTAQLALLYFTQWTSPVLAYAIFALFGMSSEAQSSYWRIICTIGGWFGWKPALHVRQQPSWLGKPGSDEVSLDMGNGRLPSFINPEVHVQGQTMQSEGDMEPRTPEDSTDMGITEDASVEMRDAEV